MKITSNRDIEKLFEILDNGDEVIVKNKDWNQLGIEWWGGQKHVSDTIEYDLFSKTMLMIGGKVVFIRVNKQQES